MHAEQLFVRSQLGKTSSGSESESKKDGQVASEGKKTRPRLAETKRLQHTDHGNESKNCIAYTSTISKTS